MMSPVTCWLRRAVLIPLCRNSPICSSNVSQSSIKHTSSFCWVHVPAHFNQQGNAISPGISSPSERYKMTLGGILIPMSNMRRVMLIRSQFCTPLGEVTTIAPQFSHCCNFSRLSEPLAIENMMCSLISLCGRVSSL